MNTNFRGNSFVSQDQKKSYGNDSVLQKFLVSKKFMFRRRGKGNAIFRRNVFVSQYRKTT